MGESLRFIATPNPQEVLLAVDCKVINLTPAKIAAAKGQTLADLRDIADSRAPAEWNEYVMLGWDDSQREGHLTAVFGAPKDNDTDVSVIPAPFKTEHTTVDYTWPAVVGELYFSYDKAAPVSIGSTVRPRLYDRPVLRERQTIASKVLIEKFTSNVSFPAKFFDIEQPMPTPIAWNFTGVTSNNILCLHPNVEIEFEGEEMYKSCVKGDALPFSSARRFPATNFKDWAPFVLVVRSAEANFLKYYERHTIYPPFGKFSYA